MRILNHVYKVSPFLFVQTLRKVHYCVVGLYTCIFQSGVGILMTTFHIRGSGWVEGIFSIEQLAQMEKCVCDWTEHLSKARISIIDSQAIGCKFFIAGYSLKCLYIYVYILYIYIYIYMYVCSVCMYVEYW